MVYTFSTAELSTENEMETDLFSNMMAAANSTTTGPMYGYGFGLPTSRAYAEYLGGNLSIQSLQVLARLQVVYFTFFRLLNLN